MFSPTLTVRHCPLHPANNPCNLDDAQLHHEEDGRRRGRRILERESGFYMILLVGNKMFQLWFGCTNEALYHDRIRASS